MSKSQNFTLRGSKQDRVLLEGSLDTVKKRLDLSLQCSPGTLGVTTSASSRAGHVALPCGASDQYSLGIKPVATGHPTREQR